MSDIDYQVLLHRADAEPVDLTEHIKVLYDSLIGSLDWGSGFLDSDEMKRIAEVGEAIRADNMLDVWAYIRRCQKSQAMHEFAPDSAPDPAVKPYRPAACLTCGHTLRNHAYYNGWTTQWDNTRDPS